MAKWSKYYQPFPPTPSSSGIDPDALVKLLEFLSKKSGGNSKKIDILDIIDRWEQREEKKKKALDEVAKAQKEKDKAKEQPKVPMFSAVQVFLMLMAFGLPVGGLNLLMMNAILQMVKDHVFK